MSRKNLTIVLATLLVLAVLWIAYREVILSGLFSPQQQLQQKQNTLSSEDVYKWEIEHLSSLYQQKTSREQAVISAKFDSLKKIIDQQKIVKNWNFLCHIFEDKEMWKDCLLAANKNEGFILFISELPVEVCGLDITLHPRSYAISIEGFTSVPTARDKGEWVSEWDLDRMRSIIKIQNLDQKVFLSEATRLLKNNLDL